MSLSLLPLYYVTWHYTAAFYDMFRIWLNFLWFTANLFSISILARTLFAPWRRLNEKAKGGFGNIEEYLSTKLVNLMMRIVGASLRLMVIFFGFFFLVLVFIVGILSFIVWALMPAVLLALIIFGIASLSVS